MDCRGTRTLLIAFHDGELPDADRGRVEAHLHRCAGCSALLADLGRADEAAGVPDPGPEYWDRFNARIMERVGKEAEGPKVALLRPKQGWMRQQLRYFIPAVAAAALVVVVVRFGGMSPELPAPASSPAVPDDRRAVPPGEGVLLSGAGAPEKERGLPGQARRQAAESAAEPAIIPAPAFKSTESNSIAPLSLDSIQVESVPSGATMRYAEPPPAQAPASPSFAGERFPGISREARQSLSDRSAGEKKEAAPTGWGGEPAGSMNLSPAPPPPPAYRRQPTAEPAYESAVRMKSVARMDAPRAAGASAPMMESRAAAPVDDSSPCELARKLAAQGRLKEAESAQRACLNKDPSPAKQEAGLVFLAELLDRQARFGDADTIIEETGRQFPGSRQLDLYRRQRPMVQQSVPAVR